MSNQKRRQERIQQLIDKQQKVIGQPRSSNFPVPLDRRSIHSSELPSDPRMNDPEYVWKQRGI
ncbi:MAG TPA: hypothetical protein VGE40_14465, partial [Bacilli bacterium]